MRKTLLYVLDLFSERWQSTLFQIIIFLLEGISISESPARRSRRSITLDYSEDCDEDWSQKLSTETSTCSRNCKAMQLRIQSISIQVNSHLPG